MYLKGRSMSGIRAKRGVHKGGESLLEDVRSTSPALLVAGSKTQIDLKLPSEALHRIGEVTSTGGADLIGLVSFLGETKGTPDGVLGQFTGNESVETETVRIGQDLGELKGEVFGASVILCVFGGFVYNVNVISTTYSISSAAGLTASCIRR